MMSFRKKSLADFRMLKQAILIEGTQKIEPQEGYECQIRIELKTQWEDKKSKYFREGIQTIVLGDADNETDHAIEACVKSMHPGEESVYLYNVTGCDEVSGEQSIFSCEFTVTLITCCERHVFEVVDEEKLSTIRKYKAHGISLYKNNEIEEAFLKFSAALKFFLTLNSVVENENSSLELREMRIALYNNLASCQLYFKNYNHAIQLCNKILTLEKNAKAFYRRALAYIELQDLDSAEEDLAEVLKLEPGNKAALDKRKTVNLLNKKNIDSYKETIRKMFS